MRQTHNVDAAHTNDLFVTFIKLQILLAQTHAQNCWVRAKLN